MDISIGDIVMPGDVLETLSNLPKSCKVILGPGLRRDIDKVCACKAGIFRKQDPNLYWIECRQKRYVPSKGEAVVGVVTNRGTDLLKVDIGSSEQASLPFLAFEGATKKNKPDIQIGDAVYARLTIANSDMEPELVCVDSNFKKGTLGPLDSTGFIFNCSLNLVHKILNPKFPLLKKLGQNMPFEIAAGMNGRIWVKAKNVEKTIAVANAILRSEFKQVSEIDALCEEVADSLF